MSLSLKDNVTPPDIFEFDVEPKGRLGLKLEDDTEMILNVSESSGEWVYRLELDPPGRNVDRRVVEAVETLRSNMVMRIMADDLPNLYRKLDVTQHVLVTDVVCGREPVLEIMLGGITERFAFPSISAEFWAEG